MKHQHFLCLRFVYLAGELAGVPEAAAEVTACLPMLAEAVRHKHYTSHVTLLETLCKTLPQLARGLSKRVFKTHLHLFLDSIFYALVTAVVSLTSVPTLKGNNWHLVNSVISTYTNLGNFQRRKYLPFIFIYSTLLLPHYIPLLLKEC